MDESFDTSLGAEALTHVDIKTEKQIRLECTDPGALPPSYTGLTEKETSLLAYVNNFQAYYASKSPRRRPFFLTPKNEAGLPRFVCTTVRPTLFQDASFHKAAYTSTFVSQAVKHVPLKYPHEFPEVLVSPPTTMEWQCGDSFDISTLLCSLLVGLGFDAYVVVGYARYAVTVGDRHCEETPESLKDEIEHLIGRDIKRKPANPKPLPDLEYDSWLKRAGLRGRDSIAACADQPEVVAPPSATQSRLLPTNQYLKLRPKEPASKFDSQQTQESRIPLGQFDRDTLKIDALRAQRRAVTGVAPLGVALDVTDEPPDELECPSPSLDALKAIEALGGSEAKGNAATTFALGVLRNTKETEILDRVHAWVYIAGDGSGGAGSRCFIDAVSGTHLPLDTPVFTGIELMYNADNVYICNWRKKEQGAKAAVSDEIPIPIKDIKWKLDDYDQWTPVLVTPAVQESYRNQHPDVFGPESSQIVTTAPTSATPFGVRSILDPLVERSGAVSRTVNAGRHVRPAKAAALDSWLNTECIVVGEIEHWPVAITRTPLQLNDRYPVVPLDIDEEGGMEDDMDEGRVANKMHDVRHMLSDAAPEDEEEEEPEFIYDDMPRREKKQRIPKPPVEPLPFVGARQTPQKSYLFRDGRLTLYSPYYSTSLGTSLYVSHPRKVLELSSDSDGYSVFGHDVHKSRLFSFHRVQTFKGRDDGLVLRRCLFEYDASDLDETKDSPHGDKVPFDWFVAGEDDDETDQHPTRAFPIVSDKRLGIKHVTYVFGESCPVIRYEYSQQVQTIFFSDNKEGLKRLRMIDNQELGSFVLYIDYQPTRPDALKRLRLLFAQKQGKGKVGDCGAGVLGSDIPLGLGQKDEFQRLSLKDFVRSNNIEGRGIIDIITNTTALLTTNSGVIGNNSGVSTNGPRLWPLRSQSQMTSTAPILKYQTADPTEGSGRPKDVRLFFSQQYELVRLDEKFYPSCHKADRFQADLRQYLIALGKKVAQIPIDALEAFYPTDSGEGEASETTHDIDTDDTRSEMTALTFRSARTGVKSERSGAAITNEQSRSPDERYRSIVARLDNALVKWITYDSEGSAPSSLVDRYRAQFPRVIGMIEKAGYNTCSGYHLAEAGTIGSSSGNVFGPIRGGHGGTLTISDASHNLVMRILGQYAGKERGDSPLISFPTGNEALDVLRRARTILADTVVYTKLSHCIKHGTTIAHSLDPAAKRVFTRPEGEVLCIPAGGAPETTAEFHSLICRYDSALAVALDACGLAMVVRATVETCSDKRVDGVRYNSSNSVNSTIPILARLRLRRLPPAVKRTGEKKTTGVTRSVLAPYLAGIVEPLSLENARRVVQQATADLKQLLLNRVAVLQAHLNAAVDHLKAVKGEDGGIALRRVRLLKTRIGRSETQVLIRMKSLMDEMEAEPRLKAAFDKE